MERKRIFDLKSTSHILGKCFEIIFGMPNTQKCSTCPSHCIIWHPTDDTMCFWLALYLEINVLSFTVENIIRIGISYGDIHKWRTCWSCSFLHLPHNLRDYWILLPFLFLFLLKWKPTDSNKKTPLVSTRSV